LGIRLLPGEGFPQAGEGSANGWPPMLSPPPPTIGNRRGAFKEKKRLQSKPGRKNSLGPPRLKNLSTLERGNLAARKRKKHTLTFFGKWRKKKNYTPGLFWENVNSVGRGKSRRRNLRRPLEQPYFKPGKGQNKLDACWTNPPQRTADPRCLVRKKKGKGAALQKRNANAA